MSFPNEQTLFRITESSSTDGVLAFTEPLSLELNKNEILVKIKAVALNYRDLMVSSGSYRVPLKKNVVAASDASGEVVKVGSEVSDFSVGDRIISNFAPTTYYGVVQNASKIYSTGIDGVLCQYKVFNSAEVNKLPKDSHLTHEEAAALVCTGVTAWNALYGSGTPFIAGQTVLLLGTGGVSITALVLAKAAGAVTIITSSSDEKLKYVQEKYGADHTINYNTYPDWDKKVLEITGGKGADFVVEVGGNSTIKKSLSSVTMGGQVVVIGIVGQVTEIPDIIGPIIYKAAHVRGVLVGNKKLAEELIRFVHAKKLRMPIEKVFGFSQDEVHKAYSELRGQTQIGKIVIKVD